jgi:H+-transporting ATPase
VTELDDGDRARVRDERIEADRLADRQLHADQGLSVDEAAARAARYGPNAIAEPERHLLREIGSHFWGPIPWMIEAALVLTATTARWADFIVIASLLLLNGGVGFWEEHQAAGAIEALKDRLAKQARVLRDGAWTTVRSEQLVPGDLVAIARGDVVPADGELVQGSAETDESALTGESLPVERREGDEVYAGAVVVRGGPLARVLATGSSTLFGRTAELAGARPPPSHFQRAVVAMGTYLIAIAMTLVGVIVIVSLARGTSVADTLEFALVVTIASVPVALPAVLSVTMAVGAKQLAEREAVVSHLPVVEEMAGVDVLCADKTGTITKNELAVVDLVVLGDADADELLVDAALTAEPGGSDPIDAAILARTGVDRTQGYRVLELQPFDAVRKRAESQVEGPDGVRFATAKGAVQSIVDLVGDGDDGATAQRFEEVTDRFAKKGYRTLAVARADNGTWAPVGLLGLQDPARDDSAATLEEAGRLGVTVKMITGDRQEIARQIAVSVGIGDGIVEAPELREAAADGADAERFSELIEGADGFAEVVPEDKYRIVEALQRRGHIVGMTGDGVNDAPALGRADAGIAVSGATDAARAAADIVLLAPGLSTIIDAIHRAREVFQRMENYGLYRITETIRVVFFVTLSILVFRFFPVTPIQVVLLAILNDGAILSIAYDRVRGSSQPVRWDLRPVLILATVLGLVGLVASFTLVSVAHGSLGLSDAEVQTLLYLKLSIAGHLTVFVARTHGRFWSTRPSWILLGAVIGTQIVATLIAVTGFLMEPIGWGLVALSWAYAIIWFFVLDEVKVLTYGVLERRGIVARELAAA